MVQNELVAGAITLLKTLISIPSLSSAEAETATAIEDFFKAHGISFKRRGNNVWAVNKHFDPAKPTVLLNSHHDTVKPNTGYTLDPFTALEENGKLYGLGSNDAGGALVSLIATFLHFYASDKLTHNLLIAATAEEEISGHGGLESVLAELGPLDFAIVGEPTGMNLAIAEKGLMVLDVIVKGKAGHAARNEGLNAIYLAIPLIEWFRTFQFEKLSPVFGPVKMSVTMISAGIQHNVVPESCTFTVDIRVTDVYTHEEILAIIRSQCDARIVPRSTRLKSSSIDPHHSIVLAGIALERDTYGSPTTSDQALLSIPSVKLGPGRSERSHTANEYIELAEIAEGIDLYVQMLTQVLTHQ